MGVASTISGLLTPNSLLRTPNSEPLTSFNIRSTTKSSTNQSPEFRKCIYSSGFAVERIAALVQQAANDTVAVIGGQDGQAHIHFALAIFEAQAAILRLERVGLQAGVGLEVTRNALQRLNRQRSNAPDKRRLPWETNRTTAHKGVDVNV